MIKTIKIEGTRGIALFLATAIALTFSFVTPQIVQKAIAADVTASSDTLSESDRSTASNHTITFTTPSGVDEGDTVTIAFPAGFSMGSVAEDDVDIADDTTDLTTAADCTGSEQAGIGVSGQTITITVCAGDGGAIAATSVVEIQVGTNATASGTGANQVTNHATAGSYDLVIDGTFGDDGTIPIVVIDNIDVTATVDPSISFAIAGVLSGQTGANGEGTNTSIATNPTDIQWGTLASGTAKVARHDLTVSTNATNGFTVTIEQDQNLTNNASDDIDIFDDGVDGAPAVWSAPASTIDSEQTYGHMGFTSEDSTLAGGDTYGSALYDALSTTPQEIFYHTGPADGTTADKGATKVGYKIEIGALQEPGAYSNTITYIATGKF